MDPPQPAHADLGDAQPGLDAARTIDAGIDQRAPLRRPLDSEPQRRRIVDEPPNHVAPLGLVGGFVDAIGGGGWGPIVTSTLIGQGQTPRYTIGSVNLAEFFVTFTISATFLATIGLDLFPIILGLIIGGIIAAPFAALATKHLPAKTLMLIVGCVIVLLSLRTIWKAFA